MTHRRERLALPAASVIRALPAVGNLMITAKNGGATHERIGTIEAVTVDDGWLVCSGAAHDSRIDPSVIATIIVDRSSVMQGQVYPRIDFADAGGTVLFSVVGFGGIEPFDAALAQFGAGEELPDMERPPQGNKNDVAEDDLGKGPLSAALGSAQTVTISFAREGFNQRWTGTVESVKPSMGFINVMRPDFHLHVRGGSVQDWSRDTSDDRVVFTAIGDGGLPSGLAVTGPVAAFAELLAGA